MPLGHAPVPIAEPVLHFGLFLVGSYRYGTRAANKKENRHEYRSYGLGLIPLMA